MLGYNFAYNFQSISRHIKSVIINLRRIESMLHDSGTMGLPELEYLVTVGFIDVHWRSFKVHYHHYSDTQKYRMKLQTASSVRVGQRKIDIILE